MRPQKSRPSRSMPHVEEAYRMLQAEKPQFFTSP